MAIKQSDGVFSEHVVTREPVAQRIALTLEACASLDGAMTIRELMQATGLAKSTVHRMCWKMVEFGLLEHSPRGFSVGSKMFALGATNPLISELRSAAIPYLVDLQRCTGAASNLAALSGGRALIVDALFTRQQAARFPRLIGHALPLHCTGTGKAIAACLSPAEQNKLLFGNGRLPSISRQTIVQPGLLNKHLSKVAATGIAIANSEYIPGIKAVAAGFRLPNGGVAAIGVLEAWNSPTLRAAPAAVADAAASLQREFFQ